MTSIWMCFLILVTVGITSHLSKAQNLTWNNVNMQNCSKDYQHKSGPRIFPCSKEITLRAGQNFTLRCQAKTDITFLQQDIPEDKTGDFNTTNKAVKSSNPEYKYEIALELINVDRYAVGYYACMDIAMKDSALNSLVEEPNDTELVSYIYIYVEGTNTLYAPMREFVTCKSNYYVVECRPTTADVEVKLNLRQSNKPPKFKGYSPKIGFTIKKLSNSAYLCYFENENNTRNHTIHIQNRIMYQQNLSTPRITGHPPEYVRGETFTLTCSVSYEQYSAVTISWDLPTPDNRSITINQNDDNGPMEHNMLSSSLTVTNASQVHAGLYVCKVVNSCLTKTASYKMILLPEPQLNLTRSHKRAEILEYSIPGISFYLIVDSRPNIINYTIYKDQVPIKLLPNPEHYTDEYRNNSRKLIFSINGAVVEDTSNYTISVSNGFLTKSETYDIRKKSIPTVDFGQSNKTCVEGMKTTFKCEVLGYPLPTVTWLYNNTPIIKSSNKIHIDIKSLYKETASLEVERCVDGTITCKAENSRGTVEETKTMQVYEVINGFGIITKMQNEPKFDWFIQNEDVKVKCLASIYKFKNVTWSLNGNDSSQTVNYSYTRHSLVAELNIRSISINGGGRFFCRGLQNNGIYATDHIDVKVSARKAPSVTLKHSDEALLYKLQTVYISCIAVGVPLPKIEWYKDNEKIESIANDTEVKEDPVDYQTLNSTVLIHNVKETNTGTYTCTARGEDTDDSQHYYLVLNEQKSEQKMKYYIIGICVIVFIFSIMVACLIWRDKKRKRRYKEELRKAGLAYFIEGATKSLNPELCIDEQADLLPYDKKFEFPAEKLIFGKKLGAGAFGVVYKAEARGIINAEETTTVAVKMVEKTADNMYIKALASELKIMIHLGKHINIVNLLGACTKNVMKRELLVIVEYCMHGNIHNYIQKHKEVFIDQFSDTNKENNLGTVNIAFSQSGSTGVHSEYFGSTNTQDTLLNTANTNNLRKNNIVIQPIEEAKASEGYVQPDWRSNYESDYSYNGRTKRPLTSRDLLCWGFQIARGMEYLSKRRIHHGDLAARNVLLAEDNVVKICDFGLARSLYKNDEYRKKENSKSLLPVKWLAIECMTEGLYTTQSDVWSFGVVLWEMFSLAKTPYPNISARDILRYLLEGKRLDKPPYSDERIYEVMKKCWERKPTARPSFTELQETLGTFLEDNVRNHYMELGAAYMEGNSARLEDYLEMVCPPDYNNLVTPSPHHYVNNQSFFAITPKLDEDGYLASPSGKDRALNPKMTTKFSFDARNFNTRPSVASSEGTERTPMLDLNNIHGSGSDSDQEGPTFADHTDTACPTIDEETDDVFETRQAKNAQNIAVTNPTYITFDVDAEKKLPLNTYVNMEPNGLVK